jgi:hypothetical protein
MYRNGCEECLQIIQDLLENMNNDEKNNDFNTNSFASNSIVSQSIDNIDGNIDDGGSIESITNLNTNLNTQSWVDDG